MAGRKAAPRGTSCGSCAVSTRLIAAGKTGEEVAAEIGVSTATLYNWRRQYGGVDTEAAKGSRRCASRTPS
ncbi:transposase [Nocardia sp. CA-135398]|uniref:transposase n=1 Tax=Nocardia sp. CA-135398 TaxID=3239977 RepID=UPI003D95D17A